MARVYSKRLLATDNLSGALTATVPAGALWIVRDIDALLDPSIAAVEVYVAWDNGAIAPTFWYAAASTGPVTDQWRGRQVLYEGDVLVATQTGSGLVQIAISGYELTLP